MSTLLVAGASGVVGQAAVEAFAARAGWQVVAVSRRAPDIPPAAQWRHLPLDLRDEGACREAATGLRDVTHVVFAALYEKPGLVAGWRDEEQMRVNLAMLVNLIGPLRAAAPGLAHVSLMQGTKAYGVHLRPIRVPARERWPRDAHPNFYWLQEDWARDTLERAGIGLTIFRPQVVFGDVIGAAMNITPVLGAYAAICREEGVPFAYPGGPDYLFEAIDARLMARALVWAASSPQARGETFNITNGDVMVWRNLWPVLAQAFGVPAGEDRPLRLAEVLPDKAAVWERVVARHGLRPVALADLLGQSHFYADFCMATGATRPPLPALVSTIKLRQAGFCDCIDTEDMFRDLIASMMERRLLPPPG
jgi:nucleoside-diphosphate-sugar epimerase